MAAINAEFVAQLFRQTTVAATVAQASQQLEAISVAAGIDDYFKQAAALFAKNTVLLAWRDVEGKPKIPVQDKDIVRQNLIDCMVRSIPRVRVQLAVMVKSIAEEDYPERWPQVLDQVMGYMGSADISAVYSALLALRGIFRKFEYKFVEGREPLIPLMNTTFGRLLPMLQYLVKEGGMTVDAGEMIKVILKIYFAGVNMEMPMEQAHPDVFGQWMTCIQTLLAVPLSEEMQPRNLADRPEFAWWNVKKWCLHLATRLFERYGDPKNCDDRLVPFAEMFRRNYSIPLAHTAVAYLEARFAQHVYVPDRHILLSLNYLRTSVTFGDVYTSLGEKMQFVVFQTCFPLLCFNDQDEHLWRTDPVEFVNRQYNVVNDYYSPRVSATELIITVARVRTKHFLPRLLGFVTEVMNRYMQSAPEQRNAREKDGALMVVGELVDEVKKVRDMPDVKNSLEALIMTHIMPEFNSAAPFLRARACWAVGKLSSARYTNPQNFVTVLTALLGRLRDPELPVRLNAALAVKDFLSREDAVAALKPHVPAICTEFVTILAQLENDRLVHALDSIVDKYPLEIAPFALQLCQVLANHFNKLVSGGGDDDDDDDVDDDPTGNGFNFGTGVQVAIEICRLICTVISAGRNGPPEQFVQLINGMCAWIKTNFIAERSDFAEEMLDVAATVTYFAPTISPEVWNLFDYVMAGIDQWGFEFISNALIMFRNVVNREPDAFVARGGPQAVLQLLAKYFQHAECEADEIPMLKMVEIVMHNCPGRVNSFVTSTIEMVLARFRKGVESPRLKPRLVMNFFNAILYDPVMTLQFFEQLGVTQLVFQTWMGSKSLMNTLHPLKLECLTILRLLQLDPQYLPAVVSGGFPQLFTLLVEAEKDIIEISEDSDIDEDDIYDGPEIDLDDNQDELTEAESRDAKNALDKLAQMGKENDDSDSEGDNDRGEGTTEDDIELDHVIDSPIDSLEESIMFAEFCTALQQRNPVLAQQFISLVKMEDVQEIFAEAQHVREALASADQ